MIRSDPRFTTEFTGLSVLALWRGDYSVFFQLVNWLSGASMTVLVAWTMAHSALCCLNVCLNYGPIGIFNSCIVLQRNLPRNYPYDNIYSLFPLTCPITTRNLIKSSADSRDLYDFERPKIRPVKIIETTTAIRYVFNKPSVYRTIYTKDLETLTDGYG